jgi:hypothetical protein
MREIQDMKLNKGTKYEVMSVGKKDEPKKTTGTFLGFTTIGETNGICIKLDKNHKKDQGRIRIIRSEIVLNIDSISKSRKKK